MRASSEPRSECPGEERVIAFLERRLDGDRRAELELHIDGCAGCRQLLAALAGGLQAGSQDADALETELHRPHAGSEVRLPLGTVVGRFVVLDLLGTGGMGVVYAAYDPELDRKVALKLLRTAGGDEVAAARARLIREAQAMARLSHPNVATVYDVGAHGDQVFIAMELVDGAALSDWLRAAPRAAREVLRVFVQAGRGLAAAHAVGLVHRDFKPHNVLIGTDGRVRVTDFGLALWGDPGAQLATRPALASSSEPLRTVTGQLVGTPAYMAPEQLEGRRADARSDQFSFCASLWEGLFGRRPFAGEDPAALLSSIQAGRPSPAGRERGVAAHVQRALVRGLAADPAARHPSFEALLAQLARDPVRRRRFVALGVLTAAMVTVGSLAVARGGDDGPTCPRPTERLAGVWDPARRDAVRAAFLASSAPGAADILARVERTFDRHREDWLDLHVEACRATAGGHQSAALLDRRAECLDQRRREWKALVDTFAVADRDVVARAAESALALRGLEGCSDPRALSALVPPPTGEIARQVTAVQETLAVASALRLTGRYQPALERAVAASEAAASIDYAPLRAQALFVRGDLESRLGQQEEAERDLIEAGVAGLAGRDYTTAAEAWISLVYLTGYQARRGEEGLRWGRHAAALLEALGDDRSLRARLDDKLGGVLSSMTRLEEARTHLERAVAVNAEVNGVGAPATFGSRINLAEVLRKDGRLDDALVHLRAALDGLRAGVGEEHPWVAQVHNNMAYVYKAKGDVASALEHIETAVAMRERLLGPEHGDVAKSLYLVGTLHKIAGDHDRALEVLGRALEIHRKGRPDHPDIAVTLSAIARVHAARGDFQQAVAHHEQALAMLRKTFGEEHYEIGITLSGIGDALQGMGRYADALVRHREALAMQEKLIGADNPNLTYTLAGVAHALELLGRHREALDVLERSRRLIAAGPGEDSPEMAIHHTDVGHVYLSMGDGRRALEAYRSALVIDEVALGPEHPDLAEDLTGHGRALLLVGDAAGARVSLERALRLRSVDGIRPGARAETEFALARALRDGGGDPARARELARAARARYAVAVPPDPAAIEQIDAWLARRRD